MSDGDLLLRAILLAPAEDTPRLVYADWLEEQGDRGSRARAEFIRVQCELSCGAPACAWVAEGGPACRPWNEKLGEGRAMTWCRACAKDRDLRIRERHILYDPHPVGDFRIYSNRLGWAEDIRQFCKYEFTRGFITRIELPCDLFLRHAAAIFAAHPVTEVVLSDVMAAEPGSGHWLLMPRVSDLWDTSVGDLWRAVGHSDHYFPSEVAAYAWASERCVTYGRRLAGLPPLPA